MLLHMLIMEKYFLLFICLVHITLSSFVKKKNYYRAAVFEYNTYRDESCTIEESFKISLKEYETATRIASKNGADIIVFPESGLHPSIYLTRIYTARSSEHIPDPKTEITNPCEQTKTFHNRPLLSKLSCLAKKNRIYLVANMVDFNKCSLIESCNANGVEFCKNRDCPDDGMLLYNTNVVFDREGNLIAKYYKKHLFLEHDKDYHKNSENIFFDTDFGRFTIFVCFDLAYGDPVLAVEKSGVVNVAYPTYWYDHFPLTYFSIAYQQAWAIDNNVNLLAANGHTVATGSLGSGIYSGSQGALIYTYNPDNNSRLLISNVPNIPSAELSELNLKRFVIDGTTAFEEKEEKANVFKGNECEMNILNPPRDFAREYRCFTLNSTNYKYTKLNRSEDRVEICTNNICCSLSYKAKSWNEDYFLGAYGDVQPIYVYGFGSEGCFLLRCDTLNSKECKRYVLKSETVFEYVKLEGNYSTKYVLPYAIDSGIRLTNKTLWKVKEKRQISYENKNKNSSLLFLALYGRHFERDI